MFGDDRPQLQVILRTQGRLPRIAAECPHSHPRRESAWVHQGRRTSRHGIRPETEDDVALAEVRMRRRIKSGPRAVAARYDRRSALVIVKLDTGVELRFPPRIAEGLSDAQPEQMNPIEISPNGLGLHFPRLDADLYVPGLLGGIFGSRSWMAATLGKTGGSRTSEAKAQATRANGRLGGRPRKLQRNPK